MKTSALYFVFLIFFISISCTQKNDFKEDESGLRYKYIIKNENERQPQPGDIIEISMYYTNEKDSILYDTREFSKVFRMKVKNPSLTGGTIDDAILLMHKGDSAIFQVDAVRFFTETKQEEVPPFIKKGEKLTFYIKLHNVYTVQEYIEQKRKQSFQSEEEEMQALEAYLKLANITTKPLSSGLYYIEKVKGKGKKPGETSWVSIHYLGTFINGEPFDNTYERNQPFEFQLGQNQVIPGLEEGVKLMQEGGEAILIIPSKLAYGDKQYKHIPPYSTLIFEIHLLKVK